MNRFKDKVVLVTGATAGIGRALALAFAREGARLVVSGRNARAGAELQAELKQLGAQAEFVAGDSAREDTASALVNIAVSRFGRLDVAVNNAGTEGRPAPIALESEENYAQTFDVNVKGMLFALKHQIPAMAAAGGGSIVNISSMVGSVGMAGAAVYVASKHAVNGLTRSAALETAAQGIRVNAVAPGGVVTPMFERFTGGNSNMQAGFASAHPLGRLAQPEEISGAVLYLASDDARFVTGSVLALDGGYTTQ